MYTTSERRFGEVGPFPYAQGRTQTPSTSRPLDRKHLIYTPKKGKLPEPTAQQCSDGLSRPQQPAASVGGEDLGSP